MSPPVAITIDKFHLSTLFYANEDISMYVKNLIITIKKNMFEPGMWINDRVCIACMRSGL